MKKTEQAKLINSMSQYWDSQTMMDGRKELYKIKTGEDLIKELNACKEGQNVERWLTLMRVANFFELMGNVAYRHAVDLDVIAGRFGTEIIHDYGRYRPLIEQGKKNQPTLYEYFEWLAHKMAEAKTPDVKNTP